MANKPRLARVARVRGEFALLVFQDARAAILEAMKDNVIEPHERRRVIDSIGMTESAWSDTISTVRAVDASDAISRAIGRSEDPRHLATLLSDYQAAVDERTELVTA